MFVSTWDVVALVLMYVMIVIIVAGENGNGQFDERESIVVSCEGTYCQM